MFKKLLSIVFVLVVGIADLFSQNPSCPTQSIYAHNGNIINGSTLPNGPPLVILNNLPAGAGGLAIGPAFAFPAPNPTWWTTAGGTYWYYNSGGTWSNTGHTVGNFAAVNIGAGSTKIYNLVGATGQIYVYDGMSNGTLLNTLVPAFGGGGPYDIVCDDADNFYILRAQNAQGIYAYNPAGVLTCSWSISGMISQTAGGGFAILTTPSPTIHMMYYNSNGTDYIGNMIVGSSNIISTVQPLPGGGDYACCSLPIPTCSILAPLGGTLTCALPQIPLVAQVLGNGSLGWGGGYNTPTTSPVSPTCGTITWSGPGIVSGQNTPTIIVNQPGVYSYTLSGCNGCPGYSMTASFTVIGAGGVIVPIITAPTCISGPSTMSVSPNNMTNTVIWTGPGIVGPNNTFTINFNQPGTYTAAVSSGTGCAGVATVTVYATPTLGIAYSSNSVCAQNINGSPNSITLTPSGATNYTLLTSANYTTTSPNGPTMPITPIAPFQSSVSLATNTLIGSNGVCSATITSNFSIMPNPTVFVIPQASVCAGSCYTYVATGAVNYTWSPPAGLNNINGATVVACPTVNTVYSVFGGSFGCNSTTQSTTLNIIANPTVVIIPVNPTVCAGNQVGVLAQGATSYVWSPTIGLNNPLIPNITAGPSVTTTYSCLGTQNTCTNMAIVTVSVIPVPNLMVSADKMAVCYGDDTHLLVNGASGFTWSPAGDLSSSTGPFVTARPLQSTTYVIIGKNGSCTGSTSISIEVIPQPNVSVSSPNYEICKGKSTSITASGAQSYSWMPSAGLNTTSLSNVVASPSVNTNYTISGSNSSGTVFCTHVVMYSVVVVPYAEADLPSSATLCLGEGRMITVKGGNKFEWFPSTGLSSTNGSQVTASPKISTVYTVNSSWNGNCGVNGTINVVVRPVPVVDAGKDVKFNADDMKFIKATGSGVLTWIDGDGVWCKVCPETQLFTTIGGRYTVEAVNEFNCKASDEVYVDILHEFGVYIPNTFTPNGDGLNDMFLVYGYSITDVSMTIYDRWGEKLFTSKDQTLGWPGTYKGEICEEAVYVYKIEYKGMDGKNYYKTGHVTLDK